MTYALHYDNYRETIQDAMDLVSQHKPVWLVDQMNESQIQREYERLYAAGLRYEGHPKRYNKLAYLHISDNISKMLKSEKCNVVYFFYGEGGELLYVGRTDNFSGRWRQHHQSDKDMLKVCRVALHVFDTKPETIFYEAQKIVKFQPPWNKAGLNGKMSKNSMEPLDIVWFNCSHDVSEEERVSILRVMELYYTQEWFDRKTDKQLEQEFYKIFCARNKLVERPFGYKD